MVNIEEVTDEELAAEAVAQRQAAAAAADAKAAAASDREQRRNPAPAGSVSADSPWINECVLVLVWHSD